MATITNLYIDAGSDYSIIVTANQSNGDPLNLTGYTVKSQIRKSYASPTAYDFTATVFSANAGKIRLALTATQTSAIKPGRYLYDVEITSSIGEKRRVLEGIIIVTPEITQI